MIRTHQFTHNLLKIILALALVAGFVLVINLIQPGDRPVQLVAANEIHPVPALDRAQQVEGLRWQAMADYYNLQRGRQIEIARWEAMAEYFSRPATNVELNRTQVAEAARWKAMVEYFSKAFTNTVLNRAQLAEAARLKGLANAYFMKDEGLSPTQLAEAARLTAMAFYYNVTPDQISSQLQPLLGK